MQRVVTLAISIVFMHIWESAQEMKTQCFLSRVCHWRAESSSFTKLQRFSVLQHKFPHIVTVKL